MVQHVAVVGASLAGLRFLEALRREGFAGRVTMIGAEAELPYDRPPLSKQFLVDGWPEEKLALARDGVAPLAAEWRLAQKATALDPRALAVALADGSRVEADAIVLATGAEARRLPFERGLEGILALRTLGDARRLRDALASSPRVVVIGAGFIGMEVAASCRAKGCAVTVVEPLPAPLIRGLGPILGERVARRHREAGVEFHLGVGVSGFEGEDRVTGVQLADGRVVPAEVVVVGVGAAPAVGWLADSGLAIDNGILCDATGASSRAGISALGDCARWTNPRYPERPRFEHWTSAVEQADVVARRIVHGSAEPHAAVPYVWTDQFDLRLAIAGEFRAEDEMHVCLGTLGEDKFLVLFGRGGKLVGAVGCKRPRQLNAARRWIAEGLAFADAIAQAK
ncbi:MAG: FAD-dependent oxidoreductase [Deltaproteobacteria bacterium]|nr:FAD-dependent oxidoreductase [Deltaproteobacteria bacterium]